MNLKLVALALAGLVSTAAYAQSASPPAEPLPGGGSTRTKSPEAPPVSVSLGETTPFTWYGIADLNVAVENTGFGYHPAISSGGLQASRLGFKGEVKLTNDLMAVYQAEAGMQWDTADVGNASQPGGINNTTASSGGATGTGPQLFARQMFAGFRTRYGTLTAGRQYSGSYLVAAGPATPIAGLYGTSASLIPMNGMPTRVNNSVVYTSPSLAGLRFYGLYTVGSEHNVEGNVPSGSSLTNSKAGHGGDAALFYAHGGLTAAVSGWWVYNATYAATETALAIKKGWQASANYNFFGYTTVYGTASGAKITGGNYENVTKSLSESFGWSVATLTPIGNSRIGLNYTNLNDKSSQNKDAELFGVMYWYYITPQARLYASWGYLKNGQPSTYNLLDGGSLVATVVKPGTDARGAQAGFAFEF
jgi:predicted porin